MRAQEDPARRCRPVEEWPEADRRAWRAALASVHPLSERRSSAADWVSATRHKNRRGYGRWLTFLLGIRADFSRPLADRVTPYRIHMYVQELKAQGVAAY